MPLSLKTMEEQIKGDQWNKKFRTVQVYWKNSKMKLSGYFYFLDNTREKRLSQITY